MLELGARAPSSWRASAGPAPTSPVEPGGRWREVPSDRVEDATRAAEEADVVLALGGGSAIDLGKAISAATGLPLVSVPTTYAGAEWTTFYGVRDPERKMRGGNCGRSRTSAASSTSRS